MKRPHPIDAARAMYHKEPCGRTFDDDLATFLRIGYVFATPTAFIMGKAVPSPGHRPYASFAYDRPGAFCDEADCDTWLIWLAAGDLREFFRFEPHPMKFLAWSRKGKLRFWPMEKVKKHIERAGALLALSSCEKLGGTPQKQTSCENWREVVNVVNAPTQPNLA